MRRREMNFSGYFEEVPGTTSEELIVVEPENDLERDVLAWAILRRPETVVEDEARRGYVFHYRLEDHLENGLYKLIVTARDASNVEHRAEIVAALVTVVGVAEQERSTGFAPFWFMSDRLHFKAEHDFPGRAFGYLRFDGSEHLPQRRLFGAAVSGATS